MYKKPNGLFVEVKKSSIHNKGLFAKKNIPKGIFFLEYTGEKVSKKEGTRREKASLKKNGTTYIFELDKNFDIDGVTEKNIAKYVNHSCTPNCEIFIRSQAVNGVKGRHIWLKSIKNIKQGEEITYDYGFSEKGKLYACKCSSKECAGYIIASDRRASVLEKSDRKSRLKRK